MSAGIFTVVKASVIMLVLMSAMVIYSGSVSSHSWPCWSGIPAMLTSLSWGVVILSNIYHICLSVATLLAVVAQPPCFFLVPSGFLMACGPLLLLQCGCQWPVWPHPEHMESLAGQEDLPGACDFVQLLHACWAVLVV